MIGNVDCNEIKVGLSLKWDPDTHMWIGKDKGGVLGITVRGVTVQKVLDSLEDEITQVLCDGFGVSGDMSIVTVKQTVAAETTVRVCRPRDHTLAEFGASVDDDFGSLIMSGGDSTPPIEKLGGDAE